MIKRSYGIYKDVSKEERAKECNNIICPRCNYHNHKHYIIKYGKCNLCGAILSKEYFIRTFKKRLGG